MSFQSKKKKMNLAHRWLICLHEGETLGPELLVPEPGDATGCQTPAAPTPTGGLSLSVPWNNRIKPGLNLLRHGIQTSR